MKSTVIIAVATVVIATLALPGLAEDTGLKRLTLRQDSLGWEGVGRLDLDDRGFCSGALVSPKLVLTAAHCLLESKTGERIDPQRVTFRAGLQDGTSVAERVGARAIVHPDYVHDDTDGARQTVSDVALLELKDPIPAAVAAPFRTSSNSADGNTVSLVSYARGRERALSWQRACSITGRWQGILRFSCDADFGSSGAPVFELSSGRPRIVSVVSRGTREGGKSTMFGMTIETPLAELRRAYREGKGVWPKQKFTSKRLSVGGGAQQEHKDIGARFVRP